MAGSKGKGSNIKAVVIAVLLVGLVLYYFNHLSNRSAERRTEATKTELELLMNYDMVGNYPKTPRDVVKLHCRYFELFYGTDIKDDELVVLNQQVRKLYSSELLAYNDENTNLTELKKNIKKTKEMGYEYRSYGLPEASQIIYYTQEGVEMATMEVTVTMDTEEDLGYLFIQYVLVNENEQWKILAWGQSQLNGETEVD